MIIPVLKLDTTIHEQVEKIREECMEVLDAFDNKESKDRKYEEVFDLVQATINLLHMMGAEEEIKEALRIHNLKMVGRRHEIIKLLVVEEKC